MEHAGPASLFLTDVMAETWDNQDNSHRNLQEGQKEQNSGPKQSNTASPALLRPV